MADDRTPHDGDTEVVVHTRPGCPFCTSLRGGLRRHGVDFREVDIWQEPEAAALVRSIADGNETVPTVVVGPWTAVNPGAAEVVAAAEEYAPGRLPERKPGLVRGMLDAAGFRTSETRDGTGFRGEG